MNVKSLAAAALLMGALVYASAATAQTVPDGIWISRATLLALPTSGSAWSKLQSEAGKTCTTPDLADQNDSTNVCVMAKALVAARTNNATRRAEVMSVLATIADGGTYSGRALALGRELAAYVIAADLIDLRSWDPSLDQRFRARIRTLLTTPTTGGPSNIVKCHEERPNNWGTHCGATRIAIASYLGDQTELARAATVFRGWLGDRSAYAKFSYGDTSWQCDPARPVGINPVGCLKLGNVIDGVLPDDERRAGTGFVWPPPKENYVYEALQGALAQAVMLERNGYPAFEWQQQALRRAFEWLHTQANFDAGSDDTWEPHVINHFYGTSYPAPVPSSPGKNVGWTDWTHPRSGSAPAPSPAQTSSTPPEPEPIPEPTPAPVPVPEPAPVPEPEPVPTPTPATIPTPIPVPPPTPVPAVPSTVPAPVGLIKAVTFESGAVKNATNGVDAVKAGVSLETLTPLKGLFSTRVAGDSAYLEEKFTATGDLYVSTYIVIAELPKSDARILLVSNAGTSVGSLVLRSNGRLRLRLGSTTIGVESQPLVPGQLYRIGIHQRAGSGGDAVLEGFLAPGDTLFGSPFAATTSGTWTTPSDRVRFGSTTSNAISALFDDVILSTGAIAGPSY